MSSYFYQLSDSLETYWLNYLPAFLAAFVVASVQYKARQFRARQGDSGTRQQYTAILALAVSPIIISLALACCYYAVVHSNFHNWTLNLTIGEALRWADYAEAGEVFLRQVGLILGLPILYLVCRAVFRFYVVGSATRYTTRTALEIVLAVVIAILLYGMINFLVEPTSGLYIVGNSGALENNLFFTMLLATITAVCSEIYFRRILLEMALQGTGRRKYWGIAAVWLGSVFFHAAAWPIILWSMIFEAGTVLLYVRWRSIAVCLCYDILLIVLFAVA